MDSDQSDITVEQMQQIIDNAHREASLPPQWAYVVDPQTYQRWLEAGYIRASSQ